MDITGEAIWVRDLIDNYHEECVNKKIKIIPACGYDSIPSDLGTYYTAKQINEPLKSIFAYHNMSGPTYYDMRRLILEVHLFV